MALEEFNRPDQVTPPDICGTEWEDSKRVLEKALDEAGFLPKMLNEDNTQKVKK